MQRSLYIHESFVDEFNKRFSKKVDALKFGNPWEDDAKLTPLPEIDKPAYIQELIDDAIEKGTKKLNDKTENFIPDVLYPVTKDMSAYK